MGMTEEIVLDAINNSGGIMSTISKRIGVGWSTAKAWCEHWESTRQALQDEVEKTIDVAEGTILNSIHGGDVQAAKWYLSTKGKYRGYSEKHDIEHTVQGKLVINRAGDKPITKTG